MLPNHPARLAIAGRRGRKSLFIEPYKCACTYDKLKNDLHAFPSGREHLDGTSMTVGVLKTEWVGEKEWDRNHHKHSLCLDNDLSSPPVHRLHLRTSLVLLAAKKG